MTLLLMAPHDLWDDADYRALYAARAHDLAAKRAARLALADPPPDPDPDDNPLPPPADDVTGACESGWTGDRCTFPIFHDGPHSNGG